MALTPILKIPLLTTYQSAKETTINDAINYLEKAMNDVVIVDFSVGNVVLPDVDLQRYFYLRTANVAGPRNLTISATQKRVFALDNSGGSNAVTVIQGPRSLVCNTGEVYVIAATGSTLKFLYNSEGAGGTIAFPSLSDVPAVYTGAGGWLVKVKATEDGLEFVDPDTGTITFLNLTDAPSSYAGQALKLVRVKAAANGVEFIDVNSVVNTSTIQTEATTLKTLALTDIGKYTRTTNPASVGITVPANATVPIPIGSHFHFRQAGAGTIEFLEAVGVTINTPSTLISAGVGATMTLTKVGINEWDIYGALLPL